MSLTTAQRKSFASLHIRHERALDINKDTKKDFSDLSWDLEKLAEFTLFMDRVFPIAGQKGEVYAIRISSFIYAGLPNGEVKF